ncbi:NAD(P)H-dependent oxidoreductase [Croceicoccus sp. BE223]|uniref:NADPH-dependent FMN reductase n=1 Tax=Croceicoccus sp. BE223 TaxID=2817716 RepID=UPI002863F3B7|nr:NAD(P)H-dependent oxidoreductase [Croceicoccus sp. BE223]MDR7102726.1 NAD(P)H-dependent FMN reductase [Croceicoccus sp. BE223]
MSLFLPVFYGSYRRDRLGIRLARYAVAEFTARGAQSELVDAKEVGLPMLDRMYKEHEKGSAPANMKQVADVLRRADGFVFVTGEYNWNVQPGLKNLMDHYLEEWFWRPAAVMSYSAGRMAGVRAATHLMPSISEMGMVPINATVSVAQIGKVLDEDAQPQGEAGEALRRDLAKCAGALEWWAHAAKAGRAERQTPF